MQRPEDDSNEGKGQRAKGRTQRLNSKGKNGKAETNRVMKILRSIKARFRAPAY
jgi:hypothetical protein